MNCCLDERNGDASEVRRKRLKIEVRVSTVLRNLAESRDFCSADCFIGSESSTESVEISRATQDRDLCQPRDDVKSKMISAAEKKFRHGERQGSYRIVQLEKTGGSIHFEFPSLISRSFMKRDSL